MHSQPGPDQFGLDERSVEELKEKAVAAKGRAYCRCCLFYLARSRFVLHSDPSHKINFFVRSKRIKSLLYWGGVSPCYVGKDSVD